uniref:Receptor-type adenylate cyclase GRESAG 4.3 n=1 Tax=Trypanosoma brucei brucei TaxID=5702 RepID=CY43_TRYBB|nr:RecName: Full=Receptor-type adenylate cyclase GRESAG 4.3; AltName: Full=ATP pyrophosphate-lyase; AltName: Full=Adenylyl cyclase [Trypanosoma brucei brucei]CAA36366.1 putative adenyl/guanylyl cyclase [Trypanosoma brucei]
MIARVCRLTKHSKPPHLPITLTTPTLFLVVLVLLQLHPICVLVNVDDGGGVTVKAISLLYSRKWNVKVINAVNAGLNASLAARNWTVAPGVNVEVVRPPSYDIDPAQFLDVYLKVLNDDKSLLVVLGPMGNDDAEKLYDTLEENRLVGFGPMTVSTRHEGYMPHLYFLRPEATGESYCPSTLCGESLRVLRQGFMYLDGLLGGSEAYDHAVDFISRMGYSFCCVFTVEDKAGGQGGSSEEFDAVWDEFAGGNPQAVIMFATMKPDAKKFLVRLVSDPRTEDTFVLTPIFLQKSIVSIWKETLEEANVPLHPHRVIQTGSNPLAKEDYIDAIKRFQTEMRNYLTEYKEWSGFNDADHFLKNDADGELMVNGWIAGEVLRRALRSHGWMNTATAFLESLYEQRRYVIDDIVVGDFGGECDSFTSANGATCRCNRGGKNVYMREIAEDYRLQPLVGGHIMTTPLQCHIDPSILRPPLTGLTVDMEDHEELLRGSTQFETGVSTTTSSGKAGEMNSFFLQKVVTDTQKVSNELNTLRQERIVTAVFGIVTKAVLGLPGLTFIDPITPTPHLNSFSRNVIHLSPTLEQQLYVLVNYLSSIRADFPNCVIRGGEAPAIIDALRKTLVTFGLNLSSTVVLTPGDTVGEHLPKSGITFIIGLAVDDIVVIEEHLRIHTKARVLVQFSDIALLYNEFVQAFNNSDGAKHLLFATSLPHWADVDTTSETVRRFHEAVREVEKWTPLSLLGFTTGRLIQENLQNMERVTSDLLVDLFFNQTVITIDDMHYGPYKHYDCIINGVVTADDCMANFGATDISVWSMARALRSDEPLLQNPMSPSLVYTVPNGNALTPAQLAGVVGGSLFVVALAICLSVLACFTLRGTRDNDSAPKEPTGPVTLIFTDIESSTALWAAHPDLMPDAVATHHRLIRSLITRYECYEVKTVGDSFMIASKSPFAAVQLAQELQLRFLRLDWETNALDESYREFEEQRAEGECEYTPPTAHMDPEVYSRLWNGLRVRVGIHTGLCDIRYDEVTKGYDYYGRTSNMAARTESVANGGQVLMTHAAYMSLSGEDRNQLDVTTLGATVLRGVPEPVRMYQLNAVPGRNFAALRLDRELFNDGEDETTTSCSDHSSLRAELSIAAQTIAASLQSLLGTFTPAQRQKALTPFCERCGVTLPRKMGHVWDNDSCQEVIRRIAAKVGHVVDRHAAETRERSVCTLSSGSVIIISNDLSDMIRV